MCIEKKQNLVIAALVLMFFMSIPIDAQFKKLTGENMVTESDIYIDENNVRYSDLITIQFKENIIDLPKGEKHTSLEKMNKPQLKEFFKYLRKTYKDFEITKVHPSTCWGDTIKAHIRTGKPVTVPDLSQIFKLKFKDLVPIDSIINILKNLKEIKNAEPPMIMYTCLAPNDYIYTTSDKWSFNKIEAEKAWDITTGSPSYVIGIVDDFGGALQLHEDLADKVISDEGYYGGHGTSVAGVAGAKTNNNQGVASLGWNVKLRLFEHNINEKIKAAADSGCSIINMSMVTDDPWENSTLRQACQYAIARGVVLVAGAGNDEIPLVNDWAPAKYDFGEDGQVLAVSATKMDGSTEKFVDGWNYSPGTDPLTDPENAFIDVAAPGYDIPVITGSSTYGTTGGTSLSAPFVSALVALILSIDGSLEVPEIYDIITKSADRIGQYSYDSNHWNRYLGYGRINAYNALKVAQGYPSKPQNLQVTSVSNHPRLTWDANTESDISGYYIYRRLNGGNWQNIANTTQTYYQDNEVNVNSPIDNFDYRIKAHDTQGKYSIESDKVSIKGFLIKSISKNEPVSLNEFKLFHNYPNPFNPSTVISFNLPKSSFVALKVYDVLGKEIANLVNENKEAGYHSVEFNASNLPSGIYFYKITAGNFSEIRKMILMK